MMRNTFIISAAILIFSLFNGCKFDAASTEEECIDSIDVLGPPPKLPEHLEKVTSIAKKRDDSIQIKENEKKEEMLESHPNKGKSCDQLYKEFEEFLVKNQALINSGKLKKEFNTITVDNAPFMACMKDDSALEEKYNILLDTYLK